MTDNLNFAVGGFFDAEMEGLVAGINVNPRTPTEKARTTESDILLSMIDAVDVGAELFDKISVAIF